MADLVTGRPIEEGDDLVNARPIPGEAADPATKDAESFALTHGQFDRGLRMGFNQLGSTANAFAAQMGESVGLDEFAAERFIDAEQYAGFANAVGPAVRDYRQVKDLDTLMQYLAGLSGQGAATAVPAAAGAALGARAGGLRGATIGVGAGSFVPNAGEQALRVRELPGTVAEKTANVLGVGGANALLDVAAPGGVLRRAFGPGAAKLTARGAARGVAKTTGIEAGTEGLQEVVGQQGERLLDPARKTGEDVPQVINAAIAGGVGGAGLAAAGLAPQAVRAGVAAIPKRGPQELEDRVGEVPDVVDSDDLSALINDPKLASDPEAIERAVSDLETNEESSLAKIYRRGGEQFEKYKDWASDPDTRAEFKAAATKWVNDMKHAPRTKRAMESLRAVHGKAMDAVRKVTGEKKSLQRTAIDANILDYVSSRIPERVRNNMTDAERMELAEQVKDFAIYGFGRRNQVEGPGEPESELVREQFPDEEPATTTVEGRRVTTPEPMPAALLHFLGKDAVGTLQGVGEILKSAGIRKYAREDDAPRAARESLRTRREGRSRLDAVILENLQDDIYANPEQRQMALEGFKRMLEDTGGNTPAEVQALTEFATREGGNEGQRLTAQGQRLMEAAGYIFKDRPKAMRAIEKLGAASTPGIAREFDLTDEEAAQIEQSLTDEGAPRNERGEIEAAASDEFNPRQSRGAFEDERLTVYDSLEEARGAIKGLRAEYDQRYVRFESHEQTEPDERGNEQPTGKYVVVAVDAAGTAALSDQQWKRITDATPGRQAGFEHGTISVKVKGKGSPVRVSLKALTAEAMRSEEPSGQRPMQYVAEMVLRGIGMLLGDSNVVSVAGKTKDELTVAKPMVKVRGAEGAPAPAKMGQYVPVGPEQMNIPPQTVVASFRGREYTWGNVANMAQVKTDEMKIRRMTENPVEQAQQAQSAEEIEEVIKPWMEDKLAGLASDLEVARRSYRTEAMYVREGQKKEGNDGLKKAKKAYDVALGRHARMEEALARVEDELDRRADEGDKPFMELGENRTDEEIRKQASQATTREREKAAKRTKPRAVQEETGLPLHGEPDRSKGGELDTGVKPEEKVGGPVTITKPGEKAEPKRPDTNGVLSVEQERLYRAAKEFVGEELARDLVRGLRADEAAVAGGQLTERQANEARGRAGTMKRLLEKGGDSAWKRGQLRNLATVYARVHAEPRKSAMDLGRKAVTPEQKKQVRTFVEKVLGPQAKVWFKNMADAGSFAKLDDVETIKIANLALDHMGTARHEAAHALMERLLESDKAAAQRLLAAAGSPTIVTRLNELLKGHPKAREQLKDPAERLAYMYQFWAAGELTVGPKTETVFDKVKQFFRTIAGLWSETFNDQRNMERAEQVFDFFDRGELADPNTVAEVLRDKLPKSAIERATETMGPAWKFITKAVLTADGHVRKMNIPAFTAIADKMYTPLGKQDQGPGFNQAKHVVANQYINKLNRAFEGVDEATSRETIEAMQAGKAPKGAKARKLAVEIQGLLREVFDYAKGKGVKAVVWNENTKSYDELDMQYVKDYFPRYYDRTRVIERQGDFQRMLEKNGVGAVEAKQAMLNLMRTSRADPMETDEQVGLTYYAPNTLSRKLNVPAEQLAPFLRKDLYGQVASYVGYMTRRAEYTERFGNQGQKIEQAVEQAVKSEGATQDQVKDFRQAVQALEGSLGHDINSDLKNIQGAVMTYQNIRLLPLALFSSLVDPIGIWVRGGTAGDAFGAFVRGVRTTLGAEAKDSGYEMAELAGSIATAHDAHMLADAYGSQYLSPWQRRWNEVFFKYNGLEGWNRSMRVAATVAAQKFVIRHATKPNSHSERYLSELNLTKDDVKVDKDGNLDLSNQKVRDAINLWVDGAVLRPNAAIRPIWMSDPHWMLVSHLKQFTYSFQKTIIARVVHEAQNGNYTPAYALASYVPMIIAADMLRAMMTPGGADDDRLEKLGLGGLLARGVSRAGLYGPGQYALDAYGDLGHDKPPLVSIAGPTAQQLYDFGRAAAGRGSVGRELVEGIPGYVLVR